MTLHHSTIRGFHQPKAWKCFESEKPGISIESHESDEPLRPEIHHQAENSSERERGFAGLAGLGNQT